MEPNQPPDGALLAQVFMASTYPLEIVQADRWAKANKGLKGDKLTAALDKQDWDASVKQLIEAVQLHRDVSTRVARARALELLKAVGIPKAQNRIDDYPHQLSGGQKARVVIARAIVAARADRAARGRGNPPRAPGPATASAG